MRPKKLILVLDPNDATLGVTMFALTINGYRVVGAHTVEEANKIGDEFEVAAVLARGNVEHECGVPVVIAGKLSIADILAELKIATLGKRGPKKRQ